MQKAFVEYPFGTSTIQGVSYDETPQMPGCITQKAIAYHIRLHIHLLLSN